MKFNVKKQLFAHDLINPPTDFSSCNIGLIADSHDCVLNLQKGELSRGTSYTLSLEDALQFGFTSAEQSIFAKELRNLILAFNLTFNRVCMTLENFYFTNGGVQIVPPESTIVFRSEVQATVSLSETFPCQRVNGIFRKLQSMGRFDINNTSTVELSNTSKALNEFENGISAYTRLTKFKHLFNALELIVNKDGKKRESDVFDLHVASLSSMQQTDVEEWRGLYNRTKHADRNATEIETYKSGIKQLGSKYLIPIRKCYQNIVLSVL